ncbi:glyoxylase-like metal-dependent hydrolase (beta-lactamase superfamily II) [Stackebrandtia albiflava]|uniref:Glyoxylase-like metal-dependent hydrolase (Beta-lactamase superfamily II) n=1 Tax=Stackebrandtia albiflava TaxID=406432 RepID=A0A562VA06_9ACTN|nr:MBL fold metallo-hydrolase [Stackebrandtia albiflava]TWJ14683.1 glyoxylase-like metal-dependent hydrolase (beta-lactamase superfamily II) [Stackebrandtia albiflava]
MIRFQPVSSDVHVLRHPVLDVNSTLVVGRECALLVDTLSCASQAIRLAEAVREVTGLPVQVVNTHDHFDHVFGNATIARLLEVADFWAHPFVVTRLSRDAAEIRADAYRWCLARDLAIAEEVRDTEVLVPNRPVASRVDIDLGGVVASVRHLGPAHTRGDLVVAAAGVLVAGDLVEEGAPPDTDGADLAGWPLALDALLPEATGPVVPGHGAVVDADFVVRQRAELAALTT